MYVIVGECGLTIDSDKQGSRGVIASPNYPSNYPGELHCSYQFVTSGDTRVQLIFRQFSLYLPQQQETLITNRSLTLAAHLLTNSIVCSRLYSLLNYFNFSCEHKYDHMTAYVTLGDRMSEIGTFCGRDSLPPRSNNINLHFIWTMNVSLPQRIQMNDLA